MTRGTDVLCAASLSVSSIHIISFLFFIRRIDITRSRAEAIVYGSSHIMNSPIPVPASPYRYRFCGLPIGVSILPRFAAIVCNTTTGIISSCLPHCLSIIIANGTNVISDTSFVIIMLLKKFSPTRTAISCHIFRVLVRRACPIFSKMPFCI